jgi:hypothetical protein
MTCERVTVAGNANPTSGFDSIRFDPTCQLRQRGGHLARKVGYRYSWYEKMDYTSLNKQKKFCGNLLSVNMHRYESWTNRLRTTKMLPFDRHPAPHRLPIFLLWFEQVQAPFAGLLIPPLAAIGIGGEQQKYLVQAAEGQSG